MRHDHISKGNHSDTLTFFSALKNFEEVGFGWGSACVCVCVGVRGGVGGGVGRGVIPK